MQNSFSARFRNWLRWAKSTGRFIQKAGSAEGNYRSPQCWEPEDPRGEPVDLLDAALLDKVYLGLPDRVRKIIKILHFRDRWRPQWQAQKLGVHYLKLEELNREALSIFESKLDSYSEKAYLRVTAKPLIPAWAG